ncbi:MAG: hypothetical protein IPP90_06000 [Gemmatimonadaceae bacterium]|nr:hypothetical protein [Gemmatimonadaceae bacterium]
MKRLVHGLSLVSMIALHVPTMAAQISPASSVADLPLIWVAPGVSAHVTAVLLSGDGGWAELIKEVADGLAAHGIGVVGFNSRAWLSKPRTREATAGCGAPSMRRSVDGQPIDCCWWAIPWRGHGAVVVHPVTSAARGATPALPCSVWRRWPVSNFISSTW